MIQVLLEATELSLCGIFHMKVVVIIFRNIYTKNSPFTKKIEVQKLTYFTSKVLNKLNEQITNNCLQRITYILYTTQFQSEIPKCINLPEVDMCTEILHYL